MNELIIVIDGNWLFLSRLFAHERLFRKDNPEHMKDAGEDAFIEMLARSVSGVLYKIPQITGVVFVGDGGSWRKSIPVPEQLKDVTYKGNRESKIELDWDRIWGATDKFLEQVESQGITVSRYLGVEGDDWAWYWSRKLNALGKNVLIWSSDQDLQQLVQVHNNVFTGWWNDRAGLKMPKDCEPKDDPLAFMIDPPFYNSVSLGITNRLKDVSYINPEEIVINKVLCGDSGDNIKSVVRYKKNNRTFRFTEGDYKKLLECVSINTIKELKECEEDIVRHINSSKKFKPYKIPTENIREMLEYNLQLVWIDESMLPETVLAAMTQFEYKEFDTNKLKDNFKILIPERHNDILDIFGNAE